VSSAPCTLDAAQSSSAPLPARNQVFVKLALMSTAPRSSKEERLTQSPPGGQNFVLACAN
jgi:hypothetical protein